MAKIKATGKKNPSAKKLNRQLIEQKLEDAFIDFKSVVGKKKLEKIIRKAGKSIYGGLPNKTFEKLGKAKEDSMNETPESQGQPPASIHDLS